MTQNSQAILKYPQHNYLVFVILDTNVCIIKILFNYLLFPVKSFAFVLADCWISKWKRWSSIAREAYFLILSVIDFIGSCFYGAGISVEQQLLTNVPWASYATFQHQNRIYMTCSFFRDKFSKKSISARIYIYIYIYIYLCVCVCLCVCIFVYGFIKVWGSGKMQLRFQQEMCLVSHAQNCPFLSTFETGNFNLLFYYRNCFLWILSQNRYSCFKKNCSSNLAGVYPAGFQGRYISLSTQLCIQLMKNS